MPLQATSGAASYDAFGGGVPAIPQYIEEVFSTWLYTGNSSTQTITNGIDLAGKGGMVWIKSRSAATNHALADSTMNLAAFDCLIPNATNAKAGNGDLNAFNSNGFSLGYYAGSGNASGSTYASWTFRKQPKFFDVVTYTGNGTAGRTIAHNLGSVPGSIIIKCTSASTRWIVYHRSLGASDSIILDLTDAASGIAFFNGTTPTSTVFSVRDDQAVNASAETYVAYLFAHDAGGFGLTGTDNVISCGSYTGNGSTSGPTINLGYEPQWVMIKRATGGTGNWRIYDTMRGWITNGDGQVLYPNLSSAESTTLFGTPTATGFQLMASAADVNASSSTYIYIAIRRGPMKVPTDATKVFSPQTATYSTNQVVTTGFPVDMLMMKGRTITLGTLVYDRLRGLASTNTSPYDAQLFTSDTSAETAGDYTNTANNTGYQISAGFSGFSSVNWNFQRAPSFFDEVCYTGNDVLRTINHNLGVAPEMMIIKNRDSALDWAVYHAGIGNTKYIFLNSTAASVTASSYWNDTSPTASVFTINTTNKVNSAPSPYVAYLFATCSGVSKVGSYTGNGSSQTINCGFTGGARFVIVKATSTTGNWIVADSARGIVAGNDPALYLNSTAAEVTGLDWIDADNSGFIVNETATIAANTNGVSYIFLAIA